MVLSLLRVLMLLLLLLLVIFGRAGGLLGSVELAQSIVKVGLCLLRSSGSDAVLEERKIPLLEKVDDGLAALVQTCSEVVHILEEVVAVFNRGRVTKNLELSVRRERKSSLRRVRCEQEKHELAYISTTHRNHAGSDLGQTPVQRVRTAQALRWPLARWVHEVGKGSGSPHDDDEDLNDTNKQEEKDERGIRTYLSTGAQKMVTGSALSPLKVWSA
jgi:hypothetical protein